MRVTPRAAAADTAMLIPRDLNDPVGLRASSLIQVPASAATRGVQPSVRVTAASMDTGRTGPYRHKEETEWSMTAAGVISRSSRRSTRSGSPHDRQTVWSCPTWWAVPQEKHVMAVKAGLKRTGRPRGRGTIACGTDRYRGRTISEVVA